MNALITVAVREVKMGLRNPWAYSFMGLFSLFMLSLLLINSQGYVEGYSGITGTILNLILYLLPLMTLMLGSFSLTGEKEDGNWALLSTYPISTWMFIFGKLAGLAIVLLTIVALGFGFAGLAGWMTGRGFDFETYLLLLGFSISLALLFLAISFLIGTLSRNRWQALTVAVATWFFLIIAWPPLLIATLGMLPFLWIKPAISAITFLNPAELSRLFTVIKLGGGSVLGPEYYEWVKWIRRPSGTAGFLAVSVLWIAITVGTANWLWERGRTRV
ncbi:hypothetical protein Back11_15310 [Paenibacillus baekrokdamisoli]|uniref:Uncharacterized protein n=1 Tax=Paenibacillus baekrokdamisoli TaxID=1712516 RepID=A0A3G9IPA3_9BACL|nr:ABC transporter permease subunit [Paenibacillus baekrokdamisoli]MBB3072797.1 Cu-processing system permease protein [Paenibacillus baekrokdamisoli]BBH20186.1 hypothetical protein Back11_15310 [Paenibacillus baekrokdamisoli]